MNLKANLLKKFPSKWLISSTKMIPKWASFAMQEKIGQTPIFAHENIRKPSSKVANNS